MGQKPKDRAARVKSMDDLLAQSRRESEKPAVGKVKFEVRERASATGANVDPRGWLFSGRPPALDDEADHLENVNPQFRVQQDTEGSGNEDPRGWLFSGRPVAPEAESETGSASQGTQDTNAKSPSPPALGAKANKNRSPGVPAPLASIDLVKARKKRKASDEEEAVRKEQESPVVQAQVLQVGAAGTDDLVEPPELPTTSAEQDKSPEESPGSDSTLQVATDFPLDIETPARERTEPNSRRRPVLLALLLTSLALAGGYFYVKEKNVEIDHDRRPTTSRQIVAYASLSPVKKASPVKETAVSAEETGTSEERPSAPDEQPRSAEHETETAEPSVPAGSQATIIEPLTPEQEALSEEERVKEARYLRTRGFRAIKQDLLDKAERSFRESLQLYPASSVSLRGLGETLALKGNASDARAWLERALRRNPADKQAQTLLDKLAEE